MRSRAGRTVDFHYRSAKKLKRNHVGLQNFAPPRASRTETLSKGETSKTDVPSANVAKFGPVAIRERARSVPRLMNPRSARDDRRT